MKRRSIVALGLLLGSLAACGDDGGDGSGGGSGGSGSTSTSTGSTGSTTTTATTTGSGGDDAGAGGAGGSGGDATGGSGGEGVGGSGGEGGGGTASCADLPLGSLEDAVEAGDHPCGPVLEAVRGRVGEQTNGSFVVWSRRTDSGLALVVSAAHTLGGGWFGPVGTEVAEGITVPAETGVLRLFVPEPDGTLEPASKPISPLYDLFHLAIPAEEHSGSLGGILPEHDAFIGLVDAQRIPIGDVWPEPAPRTDGLVPLYDPTDATLEPPTFGDPDPGEQVVLVGFPAQGFSVGAFSVGPVLTDDEADAAIAALADAGDEEGFIPYDPEVEFLVRGESQGGMSGGGAFDADGRYLGTLVRASLAPQVPQIVRIVRMSFIEARFRAAVEALDAETLAAVAPFIGGAEPPLE